MLKTKSKEETHQIPPDGHSLLDRCGATWRVDAVINLTRNPSESLTRGRGEVVAQAQEVGEKERGEKADLK